MYKVLGFRFCFYLISEFTTNSESNSYMYSFNCVLRRICTIHREKRVRGATRRQNTTEWAGDEHQEGVDECS